MKNLSSLFLAVLMLSTAAHAQTAVEHTVEGFWQDAARRILFAREAPPSYVYGVWNSLDLLQTYPSAKHIRRVGKSFELIDLVYNDDYAIKVVSAKEDSIEFVRSAKWSACGMHHNCRLEGEELFCSLENICQEAGRNVVDWRGEERYIRRANCERQGRPQMLGFPVRCR
jgi:hypothetical protein